MWGNWIQLSDKFRLISGLCPSTSLNMNWVEINVCRRAYSFFSYKKFRFKLLLPSTLFISTLIKCTRPQQQTTFPLRVPRQIIFSSAPGFDSFLLQQWSFHSLCSLDGWSFILFHSTLLCSVETFCGETECHSPHWDTISPLFTSSIRQLIHRHDYMLLIKQLIS